MARDYENYSKDELIVHIHELEKQLKSNKYGLYWDKSIEPEHVITKCKTNIPILIKEDDFCITTDTHADTHILIEGDNFHALTTLNMMCGNEGFVDVIYIDPPYNRGEEDFIYNDKYVNEDDGYRHSKWISFMHDRLQLARTLLKDTGVIFISINDIELAQLKLLCEKVFGENNFISQISWFKGYGKNESKFFSNNMEYILVYSKNILRMKENNSKFLTIKDGFNEVMNIIEKGKSKNLDKEDIEKEIRLFYKNNKHLKGITAYRKLDENMELYRPVSMEKPKDPCYFYDIIHPQTKKPCKMPKKGWRMPEDTCQAMLEQNLIIFGKDETTIPNRKYFLKNVKYETPKNFIQNSNQGGNEILDIFSGKHVFDYPKPTSLIYYLLEICNISEGYILDFFAGSGTTGQAVLELNKKDNGHRKFILCTNNENNICTDVTQPRIKTIITGHRQDGSEYSEGIPANLMYYKTDFIKDSQDTDQAKYCLVEKVDELLCIIEETYVKKERTDYYSHYETLAGNKHTFIYSDYYSADPFSDFINLIDSVDGEKIVYMFSTDNVIDERLFENINNVTLKPIPSKIYDIYKEIVEDIKRGEQ